ncbi:hypothetical protein GCM10022282_00650 [Agromyces indicus]|jgi:hypothetical protein
MPIGGSTTRGRVVPRGKLGIGGEYPVRGALGLTAASAGRSFNQLTAALSGTEFSRRRTVDAPVEEIPEAGEEE